MTLAAGAPPATDNSHGTRFARSRVPCAEVARSLGIDLSTSPVAHIDEQSFLNVVQNIRDRVRDTAMVPFAWDDPSYWLVDASAEDRSQYFAIGVAINFRFWRLAAGRVVPARGTVGGLPLTGAMYMWRCLRRATEESIPVLDASFLAQLTLPAYNKIFADDAGRNPTGIACHDRIANLRNLGAELTTHWSGQFWNVVTQSEGCLSKFCLLSRQFRAFDDPLYKLTMLNAILHSGSGLTEFDADPIPAVDYHLVKQMLRHGVVVPIPQLRAKLVQRRYLTRHEASELRRVTLIAFLNLADSTNVPGHILDNLWWTNRRNCLDDEPVCTSAATAAQCPFLGACKRLTETGMPLERTRYY